MKSIFFAINAYRVLPRVVNIAVSMCVALCVSGAALAEVRGPTVTAVSNGSVGSLQGEGPEQPVAIGEAIDFGLLKINAGRQVMMYCGADAGSGGGAVIVLGPAEVSVDWQPDRLTLSLNSGRMMSSAFHPQADQLVFIRSSLPSGLTVEAALGEGETFFKNADGRIEVGFDASSARAGSMKVRIGDVDRELATEKRLIVDATDSTEADMGTWGSENGFEFVAVSSELSVKSARDARIKVQSDLLDTVVQWDQYAQPSNIEPLPEGSEVRAEIRQNIAAAQNAVRNTTNRSGSPQTPNVQGANEVPSLSPGAISVGGVTAVNQNNAQARNLLTQTQSRGLGFNGPSRLALPGFVSGFRFIGPGGLGAQKAKR
ncbi:MAG: hypothetical protein KF841_05995 [Phycisphaerae bacterium]|nr:hypothetical protein [Phycisphaerae bacterium]